MMVAMRVFCKNKDINWLFSVELKEGALHDLFRISVGSYRKPFSLIISLMLLFYDEYFFGLYQYIDHMAGWLAANECMHILIISTNTFRLG